MDVHVQLVRAYAIHLESALPLAEKMLCYGCFVDHPSVLQHDVCTMMTKQERIRKCLYKCLQMIDESNVMKTFMAKLEVRDLIRCERTKLFDKEYRRKLWLSSGWVDDIVREITRIRKSKSKTVIGQ